jgi:hypothetical protein
MADVRLAERQTTAFLRGGPIRGLLSAGNGGNRANEHCQNGCP